MTREEISKTVVEATADYYKGVSRFGSEQEYIDFVLPYVEMYMREVLKDSFEKIEFLEFNIGDECKDVQFWLKETKIDGEGYFTWLHFAYPDDEEADD